MVISVGGGGWSPPAMRSMSVPPPPPPSTELQTLADSMSAGTWAELIVTGLSTALFIDGPNNTLGFMDKGCHDPINQQIRFIGQAHGAAQPGGLGDQRYHQYDEATNTWSNINDPPWDDGGSTSPSYIGHGYQHNAMDPATGDHYYARYNSTTINRLTRSTGVWSTLTKPAIGEITGGLEWLPAIGSGGGLIAHFGTNCWRWDKASDSWSTPADGTLTGQTYHTVAVRSGDVVIFGGGNAGGNVWSVGVSGGVTSLPDCPDSFGIGGSVTTACPVSGDVLSILGNANVQQYHDGAWSTISFTGAPSFGAVGAGSHIIAIPIAAYGVIGFLFGNSNEFWLYKHV